MRDAIAEGDRYQYAEGLVWQTVRNPPSSLLHPFIQSPIKRRITMITRTSRNSLLSRAMILPLRMPLPGAQIIPRNLGDGPGYFSVNFRIAKMFGFGSVAKPPARAQAASPAGKGTPAQPATAGRAPAIAQASRPEDRPYKFTVSLFVANLLNHTNKGTPIGNLSSPLFGTSNSLSGVGQFTFGASAAQSNRSVSLRAQFQF